MKLAESISKERRVRESVFGCWSSMGVEDGVQVRENVW